MSKNKFALITYHAAYNYGSVLQAYATQQALKSIGIEADIINYRMNEQAYFYEKLPRLRYGIRTFINDLTFIPIRGKRWQRNNAFETFFNEMMTLTKRCAEPEEVYSQWEDYAAVISGSDQIWNKYSCEMRRNEWRYMDPYLLKDYPGEKISYASSVNTMEGSDLQHILPYLKSFKALSFREETSGRKVASLINKKTEYVLDPTFLLTKEEWIEKLGLKKRKSKGKYILCYSLSGAKSAIKLMRSLEKLVEKRKCKVIVVTPFAYIPSFCSAIEYHPEYGPKEFLEALYNADAVITNSYHGTIFSINFGKEFYLINSRLNKDVRKNDILKQLGLLNRIVDDVDAIPEINLPAIDYSTVYEKLAFLRMKSIAYLRNALTQAVE